MITFEEAEIRSRIIKALAHPVRLMMVELLRERGASILQDKGDLPIRQINRVKTPPRSQGGRYSKFQEERGRCDLPDWGSLHHRFLRLHHRGYREQREETAGVFAQIIFCDFVG